MIKTLSELHEMFWEQHPHFRRKTVSKMSRNGKPFYKYADQNDYPADVRMAWVFFVYYTQRNGEISEALAWKATLK